MSVQCYATTILAHARRRPGHIALRWQDGDIDYRTLVRRAQRVAALLDERGVRRGSPVGLRVPRGPSLVIGMMGITLAGGVIVPMVPEEPPNRLALIAADCAAPVAIIGPDGPPAPDGTAPVVLLRNGKPLGSAGEESSRVNVGPHDGAYIIYTSGSTGRPKGVLVEHHSLDNYLAWCARTVLDAETPLPATGSAAFDAVLKQTLGPLYAGGTAWLVDDAVATDPTAIARLLADPQPPKSINCVPGMWRAVLAELEDIADAPALSKPSRVLLGGEAIDPLLLARTRRLMPDVEVWNLYGPTEATANASAGVIGTSNTVALGEPIAGASLWILHDSGQLAGPGQAGELFIGGPGVARGYTGQPARTAERFLPDPWSGEPGARMFRTGDVVRVTEGGALEFVGRADRVVKRSGVRVDLGEIEHALRQDARVADAVALVSADAPARLTAVVETWTGQPEDAPSTAELRAWLKGWLPTAAIPDLILVVDRLPRTMGGKVDLAALRGNQGGRSAQPTHEAPADAVAANIAEAWAQVLELDEVGVHDDFFELGGHSLAIVRIAGRLSQQFGIELDFDIFYEASTVAEQAELIRGELDREADRVRA